MEKIAKLTDDQVHDNLLTVDTLGLQQLMQCGRKTAVEVGTAAGAKIEIGNKFLWSVRKIRDYLDGIAQ